MAKQQKAKDQMTEAQINVKALGVWQAQTNALAIVNVVGQNKQGGLVYYEPKFIPLHENKKYSFMEVTLPEITKEQIEKEAAKVNQPKPKKK